MDTISKEYVVLFNAISDTIQRLREMQVQLMFYQQKAEDIYISHEPENTESLSSRPNITLLTTCR